jgi:hypothetical protein
MPDTQISEEMVERAYNAAVDRLRNAAPGRAAIACILEAALSGHTVVSRDDLVELTRICNGAEHDAKSVATKLVGHYMQHNVEVLAHTFKLIREKIKDQAAPPVPEMEG